MTKEAIHLIHKQFVESVEENLEAGGHLAVILVQLAESLRVSNYAQEVVVDYGLKEFVARLQSGQ